MNDSTSLQALEQLIRRIEDQLKWGRSEQWSNYDFSKFGVKIAEKTGVRLSVSTLKRIFGKVKYGSVPSLTTLNALAQFTEYEDWRSFISSLEKEPLTDEVLHREPTDVPADIRKPGNRIILKIVLYVAAFILIGFTTYSFYAIRNKYRPSDFSFHSKTILTEGLPNSVVFDYDATKAHEKDSVYIAQTWDISRKMQVDKNNRHYSTIYYYPGYFRAKLIIGNQVIREHDIQIRTDGWLALVEAEPGKQPLYFAKDEIIHEDRVAVDASLLKKYNISILPGPAQLRLYNQKDIHGVNTDEFVFETEVKSSFTQGSNACQRMEILLHAKNDILIVPLVRPACIGDLYVAAYGYYTDSKQDDLSGFGCNLLEWTKLKIVCKKKEVQFLINEKLIHAARIQNEPSEIVGVQYRFSGTLEVKNTFLEGLNTEIIKF